MCKYIFDLDNTLVFTNSLNNEAYNYALAQLGKDSLQTKSRITRKVIFQKIQLTEIEQETLIESKQKYFINHLDKIEINKELFALINQTRKENCVLWTSAERVRVEAILKHFKISDKFCCIYYSDKKNVKDELNGIIHSQKWEKNEVIVYDDLINRI